MLSAGWRGGVVGDALESDIRPQMVGFHRNGISLEFLSQKNSFARFKCKVV